MAKTLKTFFCSQSMVAMILVLLAVLTLLPSNGSANEQTLVMQIQDTQPKYFLGNSDQLGLCGDIYAELKSRLDKKGITVSIPTEYTPFKRILHNLEKGKADAYCGAARNPDREKIFIYSELPLYATHHVLMARIDDFYSPTSYEELIKSESRIGGLLGTYSVRHLLINGVTRINDTFLNPDEAIDAC